MCVFIFILFFNTWNIPTAQNAAKLFSMLECNHASVNVLVDIVVGTKWEIIEKNINISKRSLDDYYVVYWSHPALIASITEYKRILCNRKCESNITLPRQIHDPGFREQIKCCQNKAAHSEHSQFTVWKTRSIFFSRMPFLVFQLIVHTYIQYLMCTL